MRKKCFILFVLLAVFLAGCSANQKSKALLEKATQDESMKKKIQDIKKIEIVFDPNGPCFNEAKPRIITDNKIINDIISMMSESKPIDGQSNTGKMSGMARKNNKLVVYLADGSKKEIDFAYDTIYEVGYIKLAEKKFKPDYSFFRYIQDLGEYENLDTNIDQQVAQLFSKYFWTVDYRISSLGEKLPENLKHKAGEYPDKIYWAYNNELSKQIGLDFTDYLGKSIVAEIYRLREPLPEFMKPRRNARGVVLKYNGKIIGAYIDAGRHNTFACSLDRKSLEDITGKNWDKWIVNYIDYKDELEIRLSKMEPQEIIKEYYEALDRQDIKMVWACMTRKNLCQELSCNMNNRYLFNKYETKPDYNIKSAKLLNIKKLKNFDDEPNMIEYQVEVDFDFIEPVTSDDGIGQRFILMKKETDKSGWRIDGIGTGP